MKTKVLVSDGRVKTSQGDGCVKVAAGGPGEVFRACAGHCCRGRGARGGELFLSALCGEQVRSALPYS